MIDVPVINGGGSLLDCMSLCERQAELCSILYCVILKILEIGDNILSLCKYFLRF